MTQVTDKGVIPAQHRPAGAGIRLALRHRLSGFLGGLFQTCLLQAGDDRHALNTPASPLLDSGLRRNDDEVIDANW